MMNNPQVSVILTAYNRSDYLLQAAQSILAQTLHELELLIVDDASDNPYTTRIIAELVASDPRVRAIRREQNGGPAAARNTGAAEARSPFITFMDDDDISKPERLERQVAFLEAHPNIASVACQADWIDSVGRPIPNDPQPIDVILPFSAEETDPCACGFIWLNAFTVARRECFNAVGGYRECYRAGEDIDISLRMQEKFRMSEIPDVLYFCRKHRGDRVSNTLSFWYAKIALIISARRRRMNMPDPIESGQLPDDEFVLSYFSELPPPRRVFFIRKLASPSRRFLREGKFIELRNLLAFAENLCTNAKEHQALFQVRLRVAWWSLVHGQLRFWM